MTAVARFGAAGSDSGIYVQPLGMEALLCDTTREVIMIKPPRSGAVRMLR
ncbi:hypothetical protein [Jiangella gansuensis]|nr:hypothetical protein [Jiangella gansuensis]